MAFERFTKIKRKNFITYNKKTLMFSTNLYKTLDSPTKADIEIDRDNCLLKILCHPKGQFHITHRRTISTSGLNMPCGRYLPTETDFDIYEWEGING